MAVRRPSLPFEKSTAAPLPMGNIKNTDRSNPRLLRSVFFHGITAALQIGSGLFCCARNAAGRGSVLITASEGSSDPAKIVSVTNPAFTHPDSASDQDRPTTFGTATVIDEAVSFELSVTHPTSSNLLAQERQVGLNTAPAQRTINTYSGYFLISNSRITHSNRGNWGWE